MPTDTRTPTVRLDDDGAFDPAPDGYPGPCLLEVVPECRPGRGRFYRENAMGYTDYPAQAGVWPAAEAFDRAMPGKCYPVAVEDVISALGETIERIQLRLADLTQLEEA